MIRNRSSNLIQICLFSSSLRPGFEGCSENMNDPLYLRFDCLELLEQDEIFPECKNRCFPYKSDRVTHHVIKN